VASRLRGLFGGTFDPPHLGHVAAAVAARDSLGLDELVVTVAADPRHREPPVAPASVRLEMAEAAFAGLERVVVSDLELRRPGPTYTIDTVEVLLAEDPEAALVLVVGADAAEGLGGWHRAAELAALVTVGIVPRPGGDRHRIPAGFRVRAVAMDPVDLSSTLVRESLAAGADPAGLVPEGVVLALLTHRLYSR
jgi:nicotinate-nucleotide adenylyltransferase